MKRDRKEQRRGFSKKKSISDEIRKEERRENGSCVGGEGKESTRRERAQGGGEDTLERG